MRINRGDAEMQQSHMSPNNVLAANETFIRAKLFYAERNAYLTGMTLFLSLCVHAVHRGQRPGPRHSDGSATSHHPPGARTVRRILYRFQIIIAELVRVEDIQGAMAKQLENNKKEYERALAENTQLQSAGDEVTKLQKNNDALVKQSEGLQREYDRVAELLQVGLNTNGRPPTPLEHEGAPHLRSHGRTGPPRTPCAGGEGGAARHRKQIRPRPRATALAQARRTSEQPCACMDSEGCLRGGGGGRPSDCVVCSRLLYTPASVYCCFRCPGGRARPRASTHRRASASAPQSTSTHRAAAIAHPSDVSASVGGCARANATERRCPSLVDQ